MRISIIPIILSVIAFISATLALGPVEPVKPDATFYLAIGRAIADGAGYVDPSGFWPDQPTIGRMPLWPLVIAAGLKLLPWVDQNLTLRLLNLIVHTLSTFLIMRFVEKRTSNIKASAIAGLLFSINPGLLYYGYMGLSENLYVLTGVAALSAVSPEKNRSYYTAAFLLGLGALVKSNAVLIGPLFAILYLLKQPQKIKSYFFLTIWLLCFSIAPGTWIIRNYLVSGHFPVLSSIRGETFYGANNHYVATTLSNWGYWIFPDSIPNETAKRSVVSNMKEEKEIDNYYFNKGVEFIKSNPQEMPRLILGKVIREYVPVPWDPTPAAWAGSFYRWMLLVALIVYLPRAIKFLPLENAYILIALLLTNLATVIIFYGSARLALTLEPLLIPWALPIFWQKRTP